MYLTRYCGDAPAGAIAEVFGDQSVWGPGLFTPPKFVPNGTPAIVRLELDPTKRICDLDDPTELVRLGLRPSEVVARNRELTQSWARRVFNEKSWSGISWWSYREPRWTSFGIWDPAALRVVEVEPLSRAHPAFEEARQLLHRPWLEQ